MHPKFKPHAQTLGKVFFIDVPNEDILKYLNKKTTDAANCIVGKHQGAKKSLNTWNPELHEQEIEDLDRFAYKLHPVKLV